MSWIDKLRAAFSDESKDVKEGFDQMKEKFDAELTKREERLAATPVEQMQMIERDIEGSKSRLDEIAEGITKKTSAPTAEAEVAEAAGASSSAEPAGSLADAIEQEVVDAHRVESSPAASASVDPAKTVQEKADETLDELRAELGLNAAPAPDGDPASDTASAPDGDPAP